MTEIKEKRVSISSVVENLLPSGLCDGNPEKAESSSDGFLRITDNEYNITASEMSEGGKIVTDITVKDDRITVKRSGAIESEMIFSEGFLHKSLYTVSPYSFDCEIVTKKIRNNLTRDGGRLDIFYEMKIGGAEKRVKMRIECL